MAVSTAERRQISELMELQNIARQLLLRVSRSDTGIYTSENAFRFSERFPDWS